MHLAFIFYMNPQYLMASDYIDYLDEGATPPKGSENWIATYAQEAFDKYIKRNVSKSFVSELGITEEIKWQKVNEYWYDYRVTNKP